MRKISAVFLLLLPALVFLPTFRLDAQTAAIKTLDSPRSFPEITTEAQWHDRRRAIREQVLVSAGLWPMPEKTPLNAVISGKIERDGYSVEKVYFQSLPGFYVAGNLYRPLGKGGGPFPAILNPHGHWGNGRLEDSPLCSVPGRCINFAKQGMIAFSYDMVGFNDTRFPDSPSTLPFYDRHRSFGSNSPTALLWSVTLMGLQTWNSIRALDFLASLPDADTNRLACTGESGGGTQTFLLGAIDDRLAAQAPVVMVSHSMQGGCLCENMPGLRVEFSNMEIAASAAPRPQILVSDTRDWTRTTLTMEGPAIEHIYQLFQAPEKLRYVRFDYEHNYNQTSREAVYQWFDRWLLHQADEPAHEAAFQKEPDTNLIVFPDGKLPGDAVSQKDLVKNLIEMHRDELKRIRPTDASSLANYKGIIEPAWRRTLQLSPAAEAPHLIHFMPLGSHSTPNPTVVILAHEDGKAHFIDNADNPIGLARQFLYNGFEIAIVADSGRPANRDQTSIFFNTYNRTRLQERVRDLVSACESVRQTNSSQGRVVLCGCGHAALWSLLAAPAADAVIADGDHLDFSDDQTLLDPDFFCPGIRNIDTFAGAAILAAPHPLELFNMADNSPAPSLRSVYKALGAQKKLKVVPKSLSNDEIVASAVAMLKIK